MYCPEFCNSVVYLDFIIKLIVRHFIICSYKGHAGLGLWLGSCNPKLLMKLAIQPIYCMCCVLMFIDQLNMKNVSPSYVKLDCSTDLRLCILK